MDWIMLGLASVGAGALAAMGLGGGGVLLLYLSAVGMQQLMAQGINLLFVIPVISYILYTNWCLHFLNRIL